jgi:hypothetical protein
MGKGSGCWHMVLRLENMFASGFPLRGYEDLSRATTVISLSPPLSVCWYRS